ncbi:hypothetical protein GGI07_002219 [Coemansia sp. Benny D115]|nr:hypothetical protein GGI07_002219 [Coemansia sp. Benny D115]
MSEHTVFSADPATDESLSADAQGGNAAATGGDKPRIKMQLYKTEPCQNWTLHGICRYGNLCKFAHGVCEQRSRLRHPKYKTSMCKDFPLGKCTFGDRCNFAHSTSELRVTLPGQGIQSSPQAQALVQTPLTMLPDGRMLSTFTPVSGVAANAEHTTAGVKAVQTTAAAAPVPSPRAIRRVAGDLRRNQSMGTLRMDRPFNSLSISAASMAPGVPAIPAVPASLGAKDVAASGISLAAASATASAKTGNSSPTHAESSSAYRSLLSPSIKMPVVSYAASQTSPQAMAPAPAVPVATVADASRQPPLHYLQQEHANVARRVASMSHLSSVRKSPSQIASSISSSVTASSSFGGGNFQGLSLFAGQSGASTVATSQAQHVSALAQIPPSQYSPALSSAASFRDFDDAFTAANSQGLDTGILNSEWIRAHNTQQPQIQQHPAQHQQLLKSTQRRGLTSSVSMQTLPRFKVPVSWDQPQSAMLGGLPSSTSAASQSSIMSAQNSAATLIDSDVWSSSSCNGFGHESLIKPQESRFFPLSSTAGSFAANNNGQLGSYYGARTHPHSHYQQQLRRQQSTGDYMSLREAYNTPTTASFGSNINIDVSSIGMSAPKNFSSENRLNSLDHLRTVTSTRKQFNHTNYNSILSL